jgi:hypothetical protein
MTTAANRIMAESALVQLLDIIMTSSVDSSTEQRGGRCAASQSNFD